MKDEKKQNWIFLSTTDVKRAGGGIVFIIIFFMKRVQLRMKLKKKLHTNR